MIRLSLTGVSERPCASCRQLLEAPDTAVVASSESRTLK